MKKGSIVENLTISGIASNGRALGRHENLVIFVDQLVPGDVVDVQIYKKKKQYAEGRLVRINTYSDLRIEARCAHFGVCGGCKWQHMAYAQQLSFKEEHVAENLRKLAGIKLPEIQPILASEEEYQYRNKLEYTFSNSRWLTEEEVKSGDNFSNRSGVGFHVPGRFDKVVDVQECHLQIPISNDIRNFIKDYAIEHSLPFFDLREQTGSLRNLIVRTSTTGDLMVILSITSFTDATKDLLDALKTKFPEITSLQYVENAKRNDTISDLDVLVYHGEDHIIEKMKHLKYRIGPKSFYQTNSRQAEKLYGLVAEYAGLTGKELVYDLYTGTGTIANFLAANAQKVIGLEYIDDAVIDARINAELNGISNTEFHAGDIQKLLNTDFFENHGYPEVIITDPPRAGMHADVVECLNQSKAHTIVYVSCNSATQARDLHLLDENYEVVRIQPVDMFPQTAHVENIALLKKRQ